ncbi:hypothetical protein C8F04DRAFT_1128212 [Mycena alexandri]|uniref:F-box domain-containing protein n=1 Tax=Mycena alexandri TaxID=1745969 RepID=A0AAD6SCS6_9AGAR|nr:hypothetical protein C8F04DRAFT_1128212 [Mycena alexandri]
MLLDLSVELLLEIGYKLARSDHKNVRAVCRETSYAIGPLFFSSISLKSRRLRLEDGISLLEYLATGQTGWSTYAKTLSIESGIGPKETDSVSDLPADVLKRLLASALDSLKGIRTVVWKVQSEYALELDAISEHLQTSSLLENLEVTLDGYGDPDIQLGQFSSLRSLKITTPYWKASPIVPQVSKIVADCSGLTTLHVSGYRDWADMWSTLCANDNLQLRLKDISTTVVTVDLLQYLSSHSGIEKLALLRADGGNRAKADHLADTLVELACPAGYESGWSFGAHNIDAICKLAKLKTLTMSVNAEDVQGVEPSRNAVDLILRAVAHLPSLENVSICPASSQSSRGAKCGNPIIRHHRMMRGAINRALLNFSTYDQSSVVVHLGSQPYRLMPVQMAGPPNEHDPAVEDLLLGYCLFKL